MYDILTTDFIEGSVEVTNSLDSKIVSSRVQDMTSTYPAGFFDVFGSVPELEIDEPDELSFTLDSKRELQSVQMIY